MERGLGWVMGRKSVLYRLIDKPFEIGVSIERPVFIHATHKPHERRQHQKVIPAPQAPHSISLRPSTRQRTLASFFLLPISASNPARTAPVDSPPPPSNPTDQRAWLPLPPGHRATVGCYGGGLRWVLRWVLRWGATVGGRVGSWWEVGWRATVGATVGGTVGATVGGTVGDTVGGRVGSGWGATVGSWVGAAVGGMVGATVGGSYGGWELRWVGATVGSWWEVRWEVGWEVVLRWVVGWARGRVGFYRRL